MIGEDFERGTEGGGAPRMFAGLDLTLYGELDLSSEVCEPTHMACTTTLHVIITIDSARTLFRNWRQRTATWSLHQMH